MKLIKYVKIMKLIKYVKSLINLTCIRIIRSLEVDDILTASKIFIASHDLLFHNLLFAPVISQTFNLLSIRSSCGSL